MAPASPALAPGRQAKVNSTGEDHGSSDAAAGGVAATLAGLTRMLIFTLKGTLKTGVLEAFLRKKAFMTIGQRIAPATVLSEHLVASQEGNRTGKKQSRWQSSLQTKALGRSCALRFFLH